MQVSRTFQYLKVADNYVVVWIYGILCVGLHHVSWKSQENKWGSLHVFARIKIKIPNFPTLLLHSSHITPVQGLLSPILFLFSHILIPFPVSYSSFPPLLLFLLCSISYPVHSLSPIPISFFPISFLPYFSSCLYLFPSSLYLFYPFPLPVPFPSLPLSSLPILSFNSFPTLTLCFLPHPFPILPSQILIVPFLCPFYTPYLPPSQRTRGCGKGWWPSLGVVVEGEYRLPCHSRPRYSLSFYFLSRWRCLATPFVPHWQIHLVGWVLIHHKQRCT